MIVAVAKMTPSVTTSFAPSLSLVHQPSPSTRHATIARNTAFHGQGRQSGVPEKIARRPSAARARKSTGSNSPMLILPMLKKESVPVDKRRAASIAPTVQAGWSSIVTSTTIPAAPTTGNRGSTAKAASSRDWTTARATPHRSTGLHPRDASTMPAIAVRYRPCQP